MLLVGDKQAESMQGAYGTPELEDAHQGLLGGSLLGGDFSHADSMHGACGHPALLVAEDGVAAANVGAVALQALYAVSRRVAREFHASSRRNTYAELGGPRLHQHVLGVGGRLLRCRRGACFGHDTLMRGDGAEHAVILGAHQLVHRAALMVGFGVGAAAAISMRQAYDKQDERKLVSGHTAGNASAGPPRTRRRSPRILQAS